MQGTMPCPEGQLLPFAKRTQLCFRRAGSTLGSTAGDSSVRRSVSRPGNGLYGSRSGTGTSGIFGSSSGGNGLIGGSAALMVAASGPALHALAEGQEGEGGGGGGTFLHICK